MRDAGGKAICRAAISRMETVTMAVGRRIATLRADNFSVQGDVLVSAMSKDQLKRTTQDQVD